MFGKKKVKGRHKWCPAFVIDELQDIKREDGMKNDPDAFKSMVKYARVGREAQRLMTFNFSKYKHRLPVDDYNKKKYKRRKG